MCKRLSFVFLCSLLSVWSILYHQTGYTQVTAVPDQPGPCTTTQQTETISGVSTDIYYPSNCGTSRSAPYPGIAFAHGFGMFSDGAAENAGIGEHLASWGYVTGIPSLPTDFEEQTDLLQDVLDYLASDAQVDQNRLATVGYSVGGSVALAVAARDARVEAVFALDPVFHEPSFLGGASIWDAAAEVPQIKVPTGIVGAPPDTCNSDSDYADIYPNVGSTHKAYFHIEGASHCAFSVPGNANCSNPLFGCQGNNTAQETQLSQKYMTAWLNYYLYYETEYYNYLFGGNVLADINANLILSAADTAPDNFAANGSIAANQLSWTSYNHPIIAGYSVQRRLPPANYSGSPLVTLGLISSYRDTAVSPHNTYGYQIASRDSAGNLHQWSSEKTASPIKATAFLYLPVVMKQAEN